MGNNGENKVKALQLLKNAGELQTPEITEEIILKIAKSNVFGKDIPEALEKMRRNLSVKDFGRKANLFLNEKCEPSEIQY